MINKVAGLILVVFAWVFVTFWIFNHINAWAGIAVGVLGLIISANRISKKIK